MAYYKLSGVCSFFFDGSQSVDDNKKLLPNEIKELEDSARVISAKKNGAIELVSETEYVAYSKSKKNNSSDKLSAKEADELLKKSLDSKPSEK